ncbi:TPA: hypothetical protein KON86_002741 [Clostridioides difficile]|uniref:hypothetical protein n=1 Tax=Clostridioides difficile TaxID=1496 RepID=UPI001024EECD|nr:hypothetical protein [Clostridioides difficile]MBY2832864.1 hypothetical protein [Clostridioides difficile]VFF93641.1 DNA polymerase III, delta subunit [Clostridioides difficile]VIG16260.1 DNA polymerase III, delta subunit [Clostridioides difficile]HBF4443111.1 hypothetical protein [Clostridioides difficile]HBF4772717.1 hypothetical protein [Clostridioides difficile]
MKSKLLITNNYYSVKKEIDALEKYLSFKDFNIEKITSKIDIKDLISMTKIVPIMDSFRVLIIDIDKYSNKDLKELTKAISISNTCIILSIYYTKDIFDKGNREIIKIFQDSKIEVKKYLTVDMSEVKKLLSYHNLNLNPNIFGNADNMDVVLNDIKKISSLDNSFKNYKEYLSESFNKNTFDLIDAIENSNITKAIEIYTTISKTSNIIGINLTLLNHFNLMRQIQNIPENVRNILYEREKTVKGKANYIHEFRFKILQDKTERSNLDLEFTVNELLENDLNKEKINLEKSIVKIILRGKK